MYFNRGKSIHNMLYLIIEFLKNIKYFKIRDEENET
jgi:hypothetical protein